MLLVGSASMKIWYPNYRHPKDIDIIATLGEIQSFHQWNRGSIEYLIPKPSGKFKCRLQTGLSIEFEVPYKGTSVRDLLTYSEKCPTMYSSSFDNRFWWVGRIAGPEVNLLLKASHVHQPIHWNKTIRDYHFLKSVGVHIPDELKPILSLRKKEVDQRVQNKVNLNMSNEEFFNQYNINRYYIHDDVHRAISYYEKPMFEILKRDQSKALIDRDLFENLNYSDRLRTVREEAYVIALERVIIPAQKKEIIVDPRKAFEYALFRICTTLTKGWFREFAIENWHVIREYEKDYVDNFNDAIIRGAIRHV